MSEKVTFTIYFPNKEKFEEWLNELNIPFANYEQSFMEFYEIPSQFKAIVRNKILEDKLQDGMKDEFRWLGWKKWQDGFAEREELGMKHY